MHRSTFPVLFFVSVCFHIYSKRQRQQNGKSPYIKSDKDSADFPHLHVTLWRSYSPKWLLAHHVFAAFCFLGFPGCESMLCIFSYFLFPLITFTSQSHFLFLLIVTVCVPKKPQESNTAQMQTGRCRTETFSKPKATHSKVDDPKVEKKSQGKWYM